MYVERRTNAWAALVGFYVGRGRLAPQIASILRDGTTAETIRRLIESWGIPKGPHRHAPVPVPLSAARRRKLQEEARRHHCSPEELARRLLVSLLDNDRVDDALTPASSEVVEALVPRSDRTRLFAAIGRLPWRQQIKAQEHFSWIDVYERSDGRVRLQMPPDLVKKRQ